MGVVYEAHDPSLDRVVALKTVNLGFPVTPAERSTFEERFFREARIAAKLSHPGIVLVHDCGRDAEGTLFIALEYLKGETLEARSALPWKEVCRILIQLAAALHHAHLEGVVHRDMKPSNVMMLPTGNVKIMDFGIAKILQARGELSFAGEFFGTPLFMAPEQAMGLPVGPGADIFSLGSIGYTLLTGRHAFAADAVAAVLSRVAHEEAEPPSNLVPEIPKDLERVIGRAMAKDLARRYAAAADFGEDLEDVLDGRSPRHLGVAKTERGKQTVAQASPVDSPPWRPPRETMDLRPYLKGEPPDPQLWKMPLAVGLGGVFLGLVTLRLATSPAPAGKTVVPATQAPSSTSLPAPTTSPLSTEASAPPVRDSPDRPPSLLQVDVEHSLKYGTLGVFVDQQKVLTVPLSGVVVRKVLFIPIRRGAFERDVTVSPGDHRVRVEVQWDEDVEAEEIQGSFLPGQTRHLQVRMSLLKNLSVGWR